MLYFSKFGPFLAVDRAVLGISASQRIGIRNSVIQARLDIDQTIHLAGKRALGIGAIFSATKQTRALLMR